CGWNGGCGIELDDVSPGGVERHLRGYHILGIWDRRLPGQCLWHTEDGPCNGALVQGSYGKHVASTHLHSTAVTCKCGSVLSRRDQLKKH
ncbi:hypothetical protein BKA93DRAFT_716594, partial [Sparassis latifolia]